MTETETLFRTAEEKYNNKEFESAYALAFPLAEAGFAPAATLVGRCCMLGRGTKKDLDAARAWYERAAQQGDAEAQCRLGTAYLTGMGGASDAVSARTWYARAAQQGFAAAQLRLANMYRDGVGMRKNLRRALFYYEQAAAQGNGEAASSAALLCEIFADRKAFSRDLSMAEGGDVDAMKRVADCYEWGRGVKKSRTGAKNWYLRAAEKGDAEAQYKTGSFLLFAKKSDFDGALLWFGRAAAQGCGDAAEEIAAIEKLKKLPQG